MDPAPRAGTLRDGPKPTQPRGRIPCVVRLLALAHHFEELLETGAVEACRVDLGPGIGRQAEDDILLEVTDTRDEAAYVPDLEAAGYVLHIREPGWFERRLFKGPETDINLHVFSTGCEEIERMLRFRDHLRANPADRDLYLRTKCELARRTWQYTQHYADAKSQVVEEILRRASRET